MDREEYDPLRIDLLRQCEEEVSRLYRKAVKWSGSCDPIADQRSQEYELLATIGELILIIR